MNDVYKTVKTQSVGLYKEKGSKFLAYAKAVFDEDEVKAFLEAVKAEHSKARHHCYAYRFGMDKLQNYRVNDDGEPSGSAGRPILGQIDSFGLTNVMVIVVRYFGGTKLGIPGLINAYKTSTKEAFKQAEIVHRQIHNFYQLTFDYGKMNDVMSLLKKQNIQIKEQAYNELCEFKISMRQSESANSIAQLEKIDTLTTTFSYSA